MGEKMLICDALAAAGTIVIFILDIVYLIVTLSRGDKFTGLDFAISIGSLVLDVLTATFTVRFSDRWKSYE